MFRKTVFSKNSKKKKKCSHVPTDQGCLPQSRFPSDNGSRSAPPSGVFSALVLPIAAHPIVGVWGLMVYGTPSKLADASPSSSSDWGRRIFYSISV